ncbi:MAG: LLM class flavin-dependent oxidoreductase [Propionibacteriales bacterium]|nr:LLM class flavin-dependent oxidoreductase [Propionibacteriales bacterium]
MPGPTLGVVFRPQLAPERLRGVVEAADSSGLDELWLWEDCFLEGGVSAAAMALAWSERVRVGVGLFPVPLRNPAIVAMELATLTRAFPGRFRFGLGHGVQDWMAQVGARAASPLTLLREYATTVRGLLAGETVTVRGDYVQLTEVSLGWPPDGPPEVLIGASGPKTLELSGSVGDGTILTAGTSVVRLGWARERIDAGRSAANRSEPHRVVLNLLAARGSMPRERAHAELAGEEVDDVTVSGDAESIAAGVRRWAAAGADTVVLQPLAGEPDVEGFVRFTAEQVAPLVREGW